MISPRSLSRQVVGGVEGLFRELLSRAGLALEGRIEIELAAPVKLGAWSFVQIHSSSRSLRLR